MKFSFFLFLIDTGVLILFKFDMQFLKMFHRKVHPENSIANKEFTESHKQKIKKTLQDDGYNADLMYHDEGNRKFLPVSKSLQGTQCYQNNFKLPQHGLMDSNLSGNREYWIKTDADCKY